MLCVFDEWLFSTCKKEGKKKRAFHKCRCGVLLNAVEDLTGGLPQEMWSECVQFERDNKTMRLEEGRRKKKVATTISVFLVSE